MTEITSSAAAARSAVAAAMGSITQGGKKASRTGIFSALAAVISLIQVVGVWGSTLAKLASQEAAFTASISNEETAVLKKQTAVIQKIKSNDSSGLSKANTEYNTLKAQFDNTISTFQACTQDTTSKATNTSQSQSSLIQMAGVLASWWKVLSGG